MSIQDCRRVIAKLRYCDLVGRHLDVGRGGVNMVNVSLSTSSVQVKWHRASGIRSEVLSIELIVDKDLDVCDRAMSYYDSENIC